MRVPTPTDPPSASTVLEVVRPVESGAKVPSPGTRERPDRDSGNRGTPIWGCDWLSEDWTRGRRGGPEWRVELDLKRCRNAYGSSEVGEKYLYNNWLPYYTICVSTTRLCATSPKAGGVRPGAVRAVAGSTTCLTSASCFRLPATATSAKHPGSPDHRGRTGRACRAVPLSTPPARSATSSSASVTGSTCFARRASRAP